MFVAPLYNSDFSINPCLDSLNPHQFAWGPKMAPILKKFNIYKNLLLKPPSFIFTFPKFP